MLTSRANEKIKFLKKLQLKKYREKEQKFLIYGQHLIEEALKKDIVIEIFETPSQQLYPKSTLISESLIEYLSETKSPSKCLALCDKSKLKNQRSNKIVALNNLQDPGNVGTIIRLAKSFDFDTVIVENLDVYSDKVIRSSQGAIFDVNVITTNNLYQYLISIKNNFFIYTTALNNKAVSLNNVNFREKNIIIVFGNEGQGTSNEILKLSNHNIYIPISFESLNVATAAAIIMNKVRNG
ncbi:TrmH family RNA methyltransferase [Mycoplasma sp. 6243]|uniref:TrmH family RNA methyltransferase n=1 Tax=Mycoplasma sp. 6243 TaxID=3440865 RepID=UPI003EB86E0A